MKTQFTHGANSRRIVLSCESETEFKKLRDAYTQEFQPRSQFEADLVDQLIADRWRLQRLWSIETELLDLELFEQEERIQKEFERIPNTARTALAFRGMVDNSKALAVLHRQESRLRRCYDRTLEALRAIQRERILQNEPKAVSAPPLRSQRLCGEPISATMETSDFCYPVNSDASSRYSS